MTQPPQPLVYLASRSPRRVELLQQMGIQCAILPADIDESALADESPIEYVTRLARQKAEACLQHSVLISNPMPILGADTTVEFHGSILSKPANAADASRMLHTLSGQTHLVHTGVALAWQDKINTVVSTTLVTMMPLSAGQIEAYVNSGEPLDKAGSYGIQGLAGAWIKHIDGSYTGVMGLPVYETASLLRVHGLIAI